MRRAAWMGLVAMGATAFACAIAENGTLDADGGGADVQIPEACSTLDASCLGALAAGWQPVSIGTGSCPNGQAGVTLVTNPTVPAGGCACGACTQVGAFACDAGVPISGGDNCGDDPFTNAAPGTCANMNATQHLQAHAVQATGAVSCTAANDAGTGATTDSILVCVPGCTDDFCGGASRCAVSDGVVPCPTGLTLFAHAGIGVDPGCEPCTCEAGAPGNCEGNVTAYFNSGCKAADDAGVYAIDTCNFINQQYKSVYVSLTPPEAGCTLTSPTIAGDASLIGTKTICCQ